MSVHKRLQIADVAVVVVVVAVLLPAVHLLVDGPHLEILSLCLPDGTTQTVDSADKVRLQAGINQLVQAVVASLGKPRVEPQALQNLFEWTVPQA